MAAIYDPGMGGSIVPNASPVTEDFTWVSGLVRGCGEAALLVILHGLKNVATDPQSLYQIIVTAIRNGWVGLGGTSQPHGLEQIASSYGVSLKSGNYQSMIPQYAAVTPVIVGVSNADAFGGRDRGVGGHYVTVVGKTAAGDFIVSDPNNHSKFGQYDVYSLAEFTKARPFWAAIASSPWPGGGGIGGGISGILPNPGNWLDTFKSNFKTLFTWLTDPLRILKLVTGAGVVLVAIWLTVVSIGAHAAPSALQVAGAATGQPELGIAGSAMKSGASPQQRATAGRKLVTGSSSSRSKKQPQRSAQPKTAAPAKAPKSKPQPVYYGGKQIGTADDSGKVTLHSQGQEANA